MYRLILELPFQVTLVHRQIFQSQQEADQQASLLPQGFRVIGAQADIDALTIPVKEEKKMKTEDILRYEEASHQPIVVGDEVYLPSKKCRGRVIAADGNHLTVTLVGRNGQTVESAKTSDVMRVSGVS